MAERRVGADRAGELGRFTKRVLVVAAIGAFALLAWHWRHVLLLVFAAVLVASGLRGLAKPLYRRGVPEGAAIAAAGLFIVAAVAAILVIFGAQISAEFSTISANLPGAWSDLRGELANTDVGRFALEQANALSAPGGVLNEAMRRVGPLAVAVANGGVNVLLVVVAGVFFALKPRSYRDGLLMLAPRGARDGLRRALDLCGVSLRNWLGGTLISMTAIALMVGGGLWALGVPAPLGLALIAGLAQFVPLVGPTLSSAPAILLGFTVSPWTPLWTALVYFGASTIEANFLTPIIQRRAVSLSPVVILFSVVAFGLLFGPLGIFLAVPIAVVVTIFVVKFYINDTLGEQARAPGENGGGNGRDDGAARRRRADQPARPSR